MSIILHAGCEKTGTKAIQYWLRDHEDLLAQHGLRFPRGWLRLNVHQDLNVLGQIVASYDLVSAQVDERYNLNTATTPTPRDEGNRWTNGLRFGEVPSTVGRNQ